MKKKIIIIGLSIIGIIVILFGIIFIEFLLKAGVTKGDIISSYSNPKKAGSPVHLNLNSVPIFEFNIKSDNSICNKGDENNNRRVDWKAVNTFIVN